jgi:hypothetical protein
MPARETTARPPTPSSAPTSAGGLHSGLNAATAKNAPHPISMPPYMLLNAGKTWRAFYSSQSDTRALAENLIRVYFKE